MLNCFFIMKCIGLNGMAVPSSRSREIEKERKQQRAKEGEREGERETWMMAPANVRRDSYNIEYGPEYAHVY